MSQSTSPPPQLDPQLCTLVPEAPAGDGWIHEIKRDGWRLLARKDGPSVRLYTRGGYEWSDSLPAIAKAVSQLPCRSAWLDGELVYLDDEGVSVFDALMPEVRGRGRRLYYQCWDLLHLDGVSLTRNALLDRKAALARLLGDASPRLRFTSHVVGDGPAFFAQADALGLEGIVSKRARSQYKEGQRTRDW